MRPLPQAHIQEGTLHREPVVGPRLDLGLSIPLLQSGEIGLKC